MRQGGTNFWNRDDWVEDAQELIGIDTHNQHVATSNLVVRTADIEYLAGDTSVVNAMTASNMTGSNITARQSLQGLTINAESNLCWGGHSLNKPYPQDTTDWDDIIPSNADAEGLIHHSWIYKPLSAKDVLTDLWNMAEMGVDVAQSLWDLYNFLNPQQDIPQQVLEALQDALDGMGEGSSNTKVAVGWGNLKDRPVASVGSVIGVADDLYVGKKLKAYTSSFGRDHWNNVVFNTAPAGSTIIDLESKEAHLSKVQLDSAERTTLIMPDEIITDSNFKIGDFRMDFTDSTQASLHNSQSNIKINDITLKEDDYGITTLVSENVDASSFRDSTNFNSALNFLPFETTWRLCDRYDTGSYSTDYLNWANSYLTIKPKLLEFRTQDRPTGGIPQPLITHFSVNSNGTLYCRSNLHMNSPATIRAVQVSIDDYPREGLLKIEPTAMRYIQRVIVGSNTTDTINVSFNSNGLFLLQRNAILGKVEPTFCNFTRLEQSLENGLIFGYGLSNNWGTDLDVFKVSRHGEISSADHTGVMWSHTDSNGNIKKGALVLDKTGNIQVQGTNIITSVGEIVRRIDPDKQEGFKVSPSGYLLMGTLNITPEGLVTACNASISNLNTSNMSSGFGGFTTVLEACNSNITLSNNQIIIRNGATSNMVIGQSTINTMGNNFAFVSSFMGSYGSNTLQISIDGRVQMTHAMISAITPTTTAINYPLLLRSFWTNNDARVGIAFVGNNTNFTPGCAITHQRVGHCNTANLHFHTKGGVTATSPCEIRMSILHDGKVGIGTQTPSNLLHINGTTRAVDFIEGNSALSNKYALSNTLSNFLPNTTFSAYSNSVASFSNYICPLTEVTSNVAHWGSNAIGDHLAKDQVIYSTDFPSIQDAINHANTLGASYVSAGVGQANRCYVKVVVPDGNYIVQSTIIVKPHVWLCTNATFTHFITNKWSPVFHFKPYTKCDNLTIWGSLGTGVLIGDADVDCDCVIGTIRCYNIGEEYDPFKGSKYGIKIQGYNHVLDDFSVDGGNIGVIITGADVRINKGLCFTSATGISVNGSEHIFLGDIQLDSINYKSLQIDTSHSVQGQFIIFMNDAHSSGGVHSSGYACAIGEYTPSTGSSKLHDINITINAVNTGAKVLWLNNIDNSIFNVNINNGALYIGNAHPNTEGVRYGTGVGYNVSVKGNITGMNSDKMLTGNITGSYMINSTLTTYTQRIVNKDYFQLDEGDIGDATSSAWRLETFVGKLRATHMPNQTSSTGAVALLDIEPSGRVVIKNNDLVINNGEHVIKLCNPNNAGYKWWISHAGNETDDSCGNINFYANTDGNADYEHIAYIEDDVSMWAVRLNFTGSHRVVEAPSHRKIDPVADEGLIVVACGDYKSLLPELKEGSKENITINEALPMVELCRKRKDKRVFGVIAGADVLSDDNKRRVWHQGSFKSLLRKDPNDDRFEINALGEGAVWVCDTNGDFDNGDYITTSVLEGYGERQDEPHQCNYTLGKITCDVRWKDKDLEKKFRTRVVNGRKCAFVGCIYSCG